jgi:penicillin-binding protein 2
MKAFRLILPLIFCHVWVTAQENEIPRAIEIQEPGPPPRTNESEPRLKIPSLDDPADLTKTFAPMPGESPGDLGRPNATGLKAYLETQPDARALKIKIPAPRGQIVDRHGESFAQNTVRHSLGIQFPFLIDPTDTTIIEEGRTRLALANQLLGTAFEVKDEDLLNHYKNRKWVPMIVSGLLPEEQARKLKGQESKGVVAHASYVRSYPQGAVGGHMIGYVGKVRPLPTTAIEDGEPIFEETEGREGLEKSFDKELTGIPGDVSMLFDADGSKLSEEIIRYPTPGHNVVTSLDLKVQKIAETALRNHTNSGALVIMDCRTGDVVGMASWPSYDPNKFIPNISQDEFQKLIEDPAKPMFPRAYLGAYPPASTFKLIVAIAALQSGQITSKTYFSCPGSFHYGNRDFKNWHSGSEGSLGVISAIKRSCNTWFYQVGLKIGARAIYETAMDFGFGQSSGIPLSDTAGFIPTDQWSQETRGNPLHGGDIINMSIGQGTVLCSPLQAAQAMAGIGNGEVMPRARLVTQVQDFSGNVVKHFPATDRGPFSYDQDYRTTVIKGMVAVVSSGDGTGKGAGISKAQMAGKTGTGQWKPDKRQNLAWFTGIVPADKPLYAYAAVYEGKPGEAVSGGREAAPIVSEAFSKIFSGKTLEELESEGAMEGRSSRKVELASRADDDDSPSSAPKKQVVQTRKAEPVAEAPPPEKKPGGVKGFFRKLFGRD